WLVLHTPSHEELCHRQHLSGYLHIWKPPATCHRDIVTIGTYILHDLRTIIQHQDVGGGLQVTSRLCQNSPQFVFAKRQRVREVKNTHDRKTKLHRAFDKSEVVLLSDFSMLSNIYFHRGATKILPCSPVAVVQTSPYRSCCGCFKS